MNQEPPNIVRKTTLVSRDTKTCLVSRADVVGIVVDPHALRDVRALVFHGHHQRESLVVEAWGEKESACARVSVNSDER